MKKIKVLVVEDHGIIVDGIRSNVEPTGDIEIVGTAATAEVALTLAKIHMPQVVLMDISLEGKRTGIDAAREIIVALPSTHILFLSATDDPGVVTAVIEMGANGYLNKTSSDQLIPAIRCAALGMLVVDRKLVEAVRKQLAYRHQANWKILDEFTINSRELEIIKLWYESDLTVEDIGERRGAAAKTIENIVSGICKKLYVPRRELREKLTKLLYLY